MKRFRFPLEQVLRYRGLLAETEQARLEACQARLAEVDTQMAQLRREGERTEDAVRRTLVRQAEVSPVELLTYPNYRGVLARAQAGLAAERRRRQEELERQRQRTVEARRAREVLARAREQAHTEWEAALQREIEATAGELFLSNWNNGNRRKRSAQP